MKRLLLLPALLACACATTDDHGHGGGLRPVSITWVGPTFLTLDAARPEVKAIKTDRDGRILALLDKAPALSTSTKMDEVRLLPGALALPGLHDAHIHVLGIGAQQERVDLRGATSAEDAKARAAQFLVDNREISVLHGRGWDQSLWPEQRFPSASDLEGLTDKPVILRRVDGHAAWVNQVLLSLAGIDDKTADPVGGRIERDKDGRATGLLVDAAMDLVYAKLPKPTKADYKRWLRDGIESCARAGLVAVHDMGFPVDAIAALEELDREWTLPVRVFLYLDGSDDRALAALKAERSFRADVELRGIKLLADGAMGSHGAALIEPYSDEPANSGLLQMSSEQMRAKIQPIHDAGFQVAIHAIGDLGNRATLDAIESAQKSALGRRHRLEHAQMLHDDEFARLVPLGVVVSMQPTHATSDMRWAEQRVGAERVAGTYAWRRILDLGAPLAFGSDAPVEDERVAWGMHAALTRQDHELQPAGGWRPEQALLLEEAARAFSEGAAFAVHRESSLGRLAPGYFLDLSVFAKDPRAAGWLDNEVVHVVTSGNVIPKPPLAARP